jgi:hypothetical protein
MAMNRRALFGALLLCACSDQGQLPPLAGGLPRDAHQAQAEFDHRVVRAFPAGSPVANVRAALNEQGFDVGSSGASLERSQFQCMTSWSVRWTQQSGRLKDVRGIFRHICP